MKTVNADFLKSVPVYPYAYNLVGVCFLWLT